MKYLVAHLGESHQSSPKEAIVLIAAMSSLTPTDLTNPAKDTNQIPGTAPRILHPWVLPWQTS